jgi:hypothetical protein
MSRARTILRRSLKTLAALFIVYLLLYTIGTLYYGAQLRAIKADMAQQGLPLTVTDLVPTPTPDGDNAASLYHRAYRLISGPPQTLANGRTIAGTVRKEVSAFRDFGKFTTDQKNERYRKAAEDFCLGDTYAQVEALLEQAAAKPFCQFDNHYEDGPGMLLPQVNMTQIFNNILRVRAILAREANDFDQVIKCIRLRYVIAQHERENPIYLLMLYRLSMRTAVCSDLRNLLAQAAESLSRSQLDQIAGILACEQEGDTARELARAFDGERIIFAAWLYEHPERMGLLSEQFNGLGFGMRVYGSAALRPLSIREYVAYLGIMAKARATALDSTRSTSNVAWPQVSFLCPVINMIMPSFNMGFENLDRDTADIAITRTAIAVLQQRSRTGTFCESLEDLQPAYFSDLPREPLTHEQVLYEHGPDWFSLKTVFQKKGKALEFRFPAIDDPGVPDLPDPIRR